MSTEVSPEVREFLKANIPSHEHLEVLLFMAREAQTWSAPEISEQLELPVEVVQTAMTDLWRDKLLEARATATRQSGFAYAPASPRIGAWVDALAAHYAENRFQIIQLIGTLAIERIRNAAIHHFADAFVLKAKARRDG